MPIQVLPEPSGIGRGLSEGISALSQALGKRKERKYETEKLEKQQARQAQSGTILERILGELPPDASFQQVQGALARALDEGAEQTVVNQFAQQYAPIFKEQAKVSGAEQFMKNVRQRDPGGIPGGAQQPIDGTPETGTIYDQIDGVPDDIDQATIDAYISSPYPQVQELGKQYEGRRKESRRKFEADRTYHTALVKKGEEKALGSREALPKKRAALLASRDAIESDEIGPMSMNAFADMIGGTIGDALRTSKGAELAFASKENLISNLSRVSARSQNKWMEQQMKGAFAKVGQTGKANMQVQIQAEQDYLMEQAYLDKRDEIATKDRQRFGYVRGDVDQRAYEAVKETENKLLKRSAYLSRIQYEKEKGVPWMYKQVSKKVLQGTPMTPQLLRVFSEKLGGPEEALKRAKQLGYTIPTRGEAMFAQENLIRP